MTIIGEIAACLPREQGDDLLGIERLWSTLAGERPFLTVCGYSMDGFRDSGQDGLLPSVCAEHWAVSQALDD